MEGRFSRAVGLGSYHKNLDAVVEALIGAEDYPLASALVHFAAKRSYVESEQAKKQKHMATYFKDGLDGGGANMGAKGKKGGTSKKGVKVPERLLKVRDAAVAERAMLAAAYNKDKSLSELIGRIEPQSPGMFAAKLLYDARTGGTIEQDRVTGALGKVMNVRNPINRVSSRLSTWNASVPPACVLVHALGETGDEAFLPVLHKALFHPDIRVQADAARAIKAIGSAESIPVLAKSLSGCQWPVLIEVCDAIGQMPDKRMIKPLVGRLGKESGRFRQDVVYALSSIAGAQEGKTVREWVEWYKSHGENFEVDPAASKEYRKEQFVQRMSVPSYGFFYGLSIYSDRFCFVVDTSASMKGGRIKSLRENMTQTLNSLRGNPLYNIIDFGGDVITMYPGSLTEDRVVGIDRVAEMPLTGATRSFDALERGCYLAEVDTLIFLSDGAPIRGAIDPWSQIFSALGMINYYRPLAIMSIDFDPRPGNQQNMRWLALLNAANHISVEVPLD